MPQTLILFPPLFSLGGKLCFEYWDADCEARNTWASQRPSCCCEVWAGSCVSKSLKGNTCDKVSFGVIEGEPATLINSQPCSTKVRIVRACVSNVKIITSLKGRTLRLSPNMMWARLHVKCSPKTSWLAGVVARGWRWLLAYGWMKSFSFPLSSEGAEHKSPI